MKYLIFILLATFQMYACSICAITSPYTTISLEVNTMDNRISSIETKLVLTKIFTDELKLIYDTNLNKILDSKELKVIEDAFISYNSTNNYMTHISYAKVINKDKSIPFKVKDFKIYVQNDILHIKYKVILDLEIKNNYILYIKMIDEQKYFTLNIDANSTFFNNIITEKIVKENEAIFLIKESTDILKENIAKTKIDSINIKKEETLKKEETFLSIYTNKIKIYLLKIKDGDTKALIILCFISLLYGIIHALGPGHGKTLSFSYFSSTESSYLKALVISVLSSFIHILGALILVLVSIFILESTLNNFVVNSIEILSKTAAIFIIILSVYIFYKTVKNKNSCACCHNSSNKKQDLYFILTAGLVPCPGTVVLFIYAFMLKTYYAVFIASIFISLGMALVLFSSSFFAMSLKNITKNSKNITNIIEFLSPIFMLTLGVFLYLNASFL